MFIHTPAGRCELSTQASAGAVGRKACTWHLPVAWPASSLGASGCSLLPSGPGFPPWVAQPARQGCAVVVTKPQRAERPLSHMLQVTSKSQAGPEPGKGDCDSLSWGGERKVLEEFAEQEVIVQLCSLVLGAGTPVSAAAPAAVGKPRGHRRACPEPGPLQLLVGPEFWRMPFAP